MLAALCACHSSAHAESAPAGDTPSGTAVASAEVPVKKLGTVTVTDGRPTALPTHIPTTVEGITGQEIEQRINATDAEDALRYFPSLLVRRRNIGDYDHAVLSSRASGTGNSARSLVYADGVLLSNLLGNGASFTPRWGLVTPDEIDRVDVLYGPFSAAFPGNSVGAVVDYITRMPDHFEAHAKLTGMSQKFSLYRTSGTYRGQQFSASLGDRVGGLSWWVNVNRLDNDAQPLTFGTKLIATGIPGSVGTPVSGAVFGQTPRNQDQWIFGAGTQTSLTQDHAKLKLAYELAPAVRATYTFGLWRNDAQRSVETYLRTAGGDPVYSGTVNIDGRSYAIAATELNPNRADLEHHTHALSVKSNTKGVFDYEVAASRYDYYRDLVRAPTVARPAADAGGAGRITDLDGTGWTTLAAKGVWRPDGGSGQHLVDLGIQHDRYRLATVVSNTSNWISGGAESRFSAFSGETALTSVYAQDTWAVAERWRATLGLRHESWKARDGAISNAVSTLALPGRIESALSPKAALALQVTPEWVLKASLGRALRYPTVSELYQGSISSNVVVNNDPNLKPEKSWTAEWTAERDLGNGSMRATAFFEDTRDALYSQTNVTVFPNVTNIQNVDDIRTKGLEVSYQAADLLVKGLDLWASYTFASSIIEKNVKLPASVGKWQPRVPRHRATLLVTWRPDASWSFTAGARYGGKQYGQLDNSDPNGFAYTGFTRFFTVDLRARYRIDKQWTVGAGIDNANNAEYWNFHPYPNRTIIGEIKFDY